MVRRAACRLRTDSFHLKSSVFSRRAALGAALLPLLVVALQLSLAPEVKAQAELRRDMLKIVTATGEHSFNIEVAETDDQKARGLMFRRSLADDAGMLFPYLPPQEITMWMKNTYISLDMVFIKPDGLVHRIAKGTEPFSEAVIASQGPAMAVLEIRAGVADKIGLKPGDKVLHGLFLARGKGASKK